MDLDLIKALMYLPKPVIQKEAIAELLYGGLQG